MVGFIFIQLFKNCVLLKIVNLCYIVSSDSRNMSVSLLSLLFPPFHIFSLGNIFSYKNNEPVGNEIISKFIYKCILIDKLSR